MNYTVNYKFKLPQLVDAAFILYYNENINEIDKLLFAWKDEIKDGVTKITNDMLSEINNEILDLKSLIDENTTSINMLEINLERLDLIMNPENEYFESLFEDKLLLMNQEIDININDIVDLKNKYEEINDTLIEKTSSLDDTYDTIIDISDKIALFEQQYDEFINTFDDNDERLDILQERLITFIGDHTNAIVSENNSFFDIVSVFLTNYREAF